MPTSDNNGTTAGELAYNLPEWMAISAFTAIAWYNVLQLNVSIFLTFKRRRGLYFWSLLVSGYGVIFHSLGFLLKLFSLTNNEYISITIITIGWWPMVTGQSLVLYSRLHLVVKEEKILKGVLAMIIWNAVTLHPPTTILTYGSSSPDWQAFLPAFNIMERLQMTIFSLQELIISCIYLWAAFRLLKPVYRRRIRVVMLQLLWVNAIMVGMDISILTMEYLGNYAVEATLKSMIYAVKLVLEFAVLNQLMRLANSGRTNHDMGAVDEGLERSGHDDEEAQRERRPSRFLPQRMANFHLQYGRRTSISSPQSEKPRRVSAVAQLPDSPESPPNIATLFTVDSKDSSTRAGIPRLILEASTEEAGADLPSTIINNPAAFVQERPRPHDPLSLDGITPIPSPHEPTPPAEAPTLLFKNPPRSYFEEKQPGSHDVSRPPKCQLRAMPAIALAFDPVLTPAQEEAGELSPSNDTQPDPELLRPRRASVCDWAPDEHENDGTVVEVEVALGADPAAPAVVSIESFEGMQQRSLQSLEPLETPDSDASAGVTSGLKRGPEPSGASQL